MEIFGGPSFSLLQGVSLKGMYLFFSTMAAFLPISAHGIEVIMFLYLDMGEGKVGSGVNIP